MYNYIKDVLGDDVVKVDYILPADCPMYLKHEYSCTKYIIAAQECLFVCPVAFNLVRYKKHCEKLMQMTGMPVVVQLESITAYQRKALITEKISFVVKDSQIYLPFLAICLTEKYERKAVIERFTPITQLVFLYIFYNNIRMTATEISKELGCTVMSATRAYKALLDCGLFRSECSGRKKYIVPVTRGGELLRMAEPYMIDPVERVLYLDNSIACIEALVSGVDALGRKTMLNTTGRDRCYAFAKYLQPSVGEQITKQDYLTIDGKKAEVWSYDPRLLSPDYTVDDISLILSLKNAKDERVLAEVETLRRKYAW